MGLFKTVTTTDYRMSRNRWPTDLDCLKDMSWQDFEYFVADLYSAMGYRVYRKQLSNDLSRDVLADKDSHRTVIQAKHYTGRRVKSNELTDYINLLLEDDVDHVTLVTTTTLTGQGWKKLNRYEDMDIVTGDQVEDWATKYRPRVGEADIQHEAESVREQAVTEDGVENRPSYDTLGKQLGRAYRSYLKFGLGLFALPLSFTVWYFKTIWDFVKAVFGIGDGDG